MPGSELELTANSRKKTYSLTVVNGVIGDREWDTKLKVKMPGHAATAKATYKDKVPTTYTLTVIGGYIGDDEAKASGDYGSQCRNQSDGQRQRPVITSPSGR